MSLSKIETVRVPATTDYIGVYLTNRCFLACPYCLTDYNEPFRNQDIAGELPPAGWIDGLNRLELPDGVPLTFQGGEPFLYQGIWELLNQVRHKIDILTALPPTVTVARIKQLKTRQWNQRPAPYPLIRVSFHKGQNDYQDLIHRIRELQEACGLSIGLYHIDHPGYPEMTAEIRDYARQHGVEFRTKAFLGRHNGEDCGEYKYPQACQGTVARPRVWCRNTVFPIGPDGTIFRCHSDLYAQRREAALGNLLDPDLRLEHAYRPCAAYGCCSPCDVKVKTNHLQKFGYTSVDIRFDDAA